MFSVYNEELFQPLIDCIQHNSHAHTITFLGLTRDFASPKFFDLLKDNDYYYRKIPDHAFVGSSSISEDNSQSNSVQFDENSAWNTPATEERIGIFIVYKK